MPLPETAEKMAVADVVHGSGSAVLPRISGTATAHARPRKPTDKCARHTAAKRCLIAAERLYPGAATTQSALASERGATLRRRTVVNGHAIAVVAAIRARRAAGACGLRRSLCA